MNFSKRRYTPELLDSPGIAQEDIERNLYELSVINRNLGGHAITWKGFKALVQGDCENQICEIGCGGGDNLKAIEKKAAHFKKLSFFGIDINPYCITVAEKIKWKAPVQFLVNDYKNVKFISAPDIIFSSLFCHHFHEDELVDMLKWMHVNSRNGFFINDLHRHFLAFYSIRLLTSVFSKSYLVKNDAPLSVLRGFKRSELVNLLEKAGIIHYTIQWKWAFRWLIVVRK